jgi:hypothetical protein
LFYYISKIYLPKKQQATDTTPMVVWLRRILSDPLVTKVVHDCRMDSDVLFYRLVKTVHCLNRQLYSISSMCVFDLMIFEQSVELCNIHDTSCWDAVLTGTLQVSIWCCVLPNPRDNVCVVYFKGKENSSLNEALAHNGLPANDNRDKLEYTRNRAFWLQRPLTDRMVQWAAGDIDALKSLYACQIQQASAAQRAESEVSELSQ